MPMPNPKNTALLGAGQSLGLSDQLVEQVDEQAAALKKKKQDIGMGADTSDPYGSASTALLGTGLKI